MTHRNVALAVVVMSLALPVGLADAEELTGLTLINARTNQAIGRLNDGDTVDLSKVGGDLNV